MLEFLRDPLAETRRLAAQQARRDAAAIAREYGEMQYKALCLTSLDKAHTILTTVDKISARILAGVNYD